MNRGQFKRSPKTTIHLQIPKKQTRLGESTIHSEWTFSVRTVMPKGR